MRSVLALGLFINLCASANAATVHRSRSSGVHLRTGQRVPSVPTDVLPPSLPDALTSPPPDDAKTCELDHIAHARTQLTTPKPASSCGRAFGNRK
jgi:hypothetical protein